MTGLTQTLELGYKWWVLLRHSAVAATEGKSQCLGGRRKFFPPATSMFGKSEGERKKVSKCRLDPTLTNRRTDGSVVASN